MKILDCTQLVGFHILVVSQWSFGALICSGDLSLDVHEFLGIFHMEGDTHQVEQNSLVIHSLPFEKSGENCVIYHR